MALRVVPETRLPTSRPGQGLLAAIAGHMTAYSEKLPACELLFELLMPALRLDVCCHYRADARGSFKFAASQGLSELELSHVEHTLAARVEQVARERQPVILNDLQDTDDDALAFERDIGLRSQAYIPLIVDNQVTGVVSFGRKTWRNFSHREIAFFRAAAGYTALAEQHFERDRALRASEERLRLAQELGGIGSFEWDLLTGQAHATRGWSEIIGYGRDTSPTFANLLKVVLADDVDAFRADVDKAMRTGSSYRGEFRIVRPDNGDIRWIRVDGGIVRDAEGRAIHMVGIGRDVTDRRSLQEREHLLMRELDHRAKNLLTIIQSVIQLSKSEDIGSFVEAVSGRIQALARAHSLLASSRWEGGSLTALVAEEVAPFVGGPDRVLIEGPPITLKPAAAQSVALVLHELVTNAAKYGALSNEQGTVTISWSLRLGSEDQLVLEWRERGGPAVVMPSHRGFGTTVINASVERQLGGRARFEWGAEGLSCTLVLPARQLVCTAKAGGGVSSEPKQNAALSDERSGRILVVEDEPLIALQLVQMLEGAGATVLGPAASISEALELARSEPFDFALLDVDLNGARSYPLADVLTEQGRPYAFLTSFSASELPERFSGSIVLAKPISKIELETLVRAMPTATANDLRSVASASL